MRTGGAGSLALLIVAVTMTVVGCVPEPDPLWHPPVWPAVSLSVVSDAPAAPEVAPLALDPQRIRNDAVGVQARFGLLPGTGPLVDPFNTRVKEFVRAVLEQRSAASGVRYSPTVLPRGAGLGERGCVPGSTARPGPELLADPGYGPEGGRGSAVICELAVSSGHILGMRLRAVSGGPEGVTSDVSASLFVDTATGETATDAELWADSSASIVTLELITMLRQGARALSMRSAESADERQVEAVREALQRAVPGVDGSFTVTIAPGFDFGGLSDLETDAAQAPLKVNIPREAATSLLSPFGVKLQSTAGQPYAGPMGVPPGRQPVDCALVPCVAVTYDDGPSALTPGILEALAAHRSAATFFAMGENARPFADVIARIVAEGNEVQNHTWDHPVLTSLSSARVSTQIRDTTRALSAITAEPVSLFRPPKGLYNERVLDAAGLAAILWDVDTFDWQAPRDDVLIARAVDQPRPGSIVLMHDVHAVTARTAGAVYEGLRDRGFTLVTVSQLFGGELPASGVWRHGP